MEHQNREALINRNLWSGYIIAVKCLAVMIAASKCHELAVFVLTYGKISCFVTGIGRFSVQRMIIDSEERPWL